MSEIPYFVTVDAETEAISEGVQVISKIREEIEEESGVRIPIIWFVRFQHGFNESVKSDGVDSFKYPITRFYDGFDLAAKQLHEFQDRGDEIGWHYHAYNYIYRPDLGHTSRIEILSADLVRCANEIKARHAHFTIGAFRFGWFFIPDYTIFQTLKELGIRADASINPRKQGKVANSTVCFLKPPLKTIKEIERMWFFPRTAQTLSVHDWTVVPHQFSWSSQNKQDALNNQTEFKKMLVSTVEEAKRNGSSFISYHDYLQSL